MVIPLVVIRVIVIAIQVIQVIAVIQSTIAVITPISTITESTPLIDCTTYPTPPPVHPIPCSLRICSFRQVPFATHARLCLARIIKIKNLEGEEGMLLECICLLWLSILPDRSIPRTLSGQLIIHIAIHLEVRIEQLD